MARPGAGKIVQAVDTIVFIGDEQGDGAAQGDAAPNAAQDIDPVGFEPLPAAAPVTALAAVKLGVDQFRLDSTPAGNPSTRASRALPCDSPAVRYRNIPIPDVLAITTVPFHFPNDRQILHYPTPIGTGRFCGHLLSLSPLPPVHIIYHYWPQIVVLRPRRPSDEGLGRLLQHVW